MTKVLFIGDSRKMKGGVSTVIKAIESSYIWQKYKCHWVQCQINAAKWLKVFYLLRGCMDSFFRMPFYDVAYFHTAVGTSMIVQLPMFLYAKLCRKKIIVEIHVGNQINEHLKDGVFRYWVNNSNLVLTLGKKWRDLLAQEEWVKTEVHYLYNPAPDVTTPVEPKKYFLFAAYLDFNKGYDTLIEAFAKVVKYHSEWKLILCGVGNIKDVKERIVKAGIEKNVELPGWVGGEEKLKYFKEAYAYCMTSEKEGLPMSVLESMAYGVPVISTYVGCLPEIIHDEESALMYNYGDVDALTATMELIISDPPLRSRLSKKGQEIIINDFTDDVVMKKLDGFFETLSL